MPCDCETSAFGEAESRIDHAAGMVRGYIVCACGKRERIVWEKPIGQHLKPPPEKPPPR